MSLTDFGTRQAGLHRQPARYPTTRRNAWMRRVVGLSAGGLAVGVAIGLLMGG